MNGNFPTPLLHRALYMVKVLVAQFQVFFLATVLSEQFRELKAMGTALSEMLTALSERLTALSDQVTALA